MILKRLLCEFLIPFGKQISSSFDKCTKPIDSFVLVIKLFGPCFAHERVYGLRFSKRVVLLIIIVWSYVVIQGVLLCEHDKGEAKNLWNKALS